MPCIQNDVREILQRSKKLCILTCKRDPMVRDRDIWSSVRDEIETETFPRFHETETSPRRLKTTSRDRLETETSRPRLHPCRLVYLYFALGNGAKYFDEHVSISVCLFAHISKKQTTHQSFIVLCFCHLWLWHGPPLTAVQFVCTLPVLWMTSWLPIMGHMACL